jgi:translation initiation factor IF-3
LIDSSGEMQGVVALNIALNKAAEEGLDLVEISPNAEPPVCKIMDLGKFLYEEQRKKKEAKKKQKVQEVKEIKLRPNTDKNDLTTKLNHVKKFLEEGDKVKFSLKFRGREFEHKEFGHERLNFFIDNTKDIAKIENSIRMEGSQMTLTLTPIVAAKP